MRIFVYLFIFSSANTSRVLGNPLLTATETKLQNKNIKNFAQKREKMCSLKIRQVQSC